MNSVSSVWPARNFSASLSKSSNSRRRIGITCPGTSSWTSGFSIDPLRPVVVEGSIADKVPRSPETRSGFICRILIGVGSFIPHAGRAPRRGDPGSGRALRRRAPGARRLVAEGDRGADRPGARARAGGAHLHARHRRAVRGDLRDLARGRAALRHRRRVLPRRLGPRAVGDRARPLLLPAQGGAAAARARGRRLLDLRRPARPVARPRADRGARLGRAPRAVEGQPARHVERARRVGVHRRARPAVQPPPRPGLLLDRLHALHAAGRGARGALGRTGEDGMRTARAGRALTHLEALEAEAIHVIREVAAELERPVLLFSGGKDSIVLAHLARKAFRPGPVPLPLMHVDTGHNFPEVIAFRDRFVAELEIELIVASVQESIDTGRVVEETGPRASRNRLQTVTLLDAIEAHGFDAAFGGARRDEERARAKERIFSFRDDFGQWDPRRQRPELWNLYNGRVRRGEHVRVFPIS